MDSGKSPVNACEEIAGELSDMARWLSGGELSPEQFRDAVNTLEARKLARFGFALASEVAPDGRVLFSLRYATSGELCASMDVDPDTGELHIQPACA
jgi:hypothetical protein